MLVYQRVMESIVCWCVLSFVRCVSVIHARHGMVMNGLASFEAQFDGRHCRIRVFGPSGSTDCNGCGDCDLKLLERMHCKRWLGILYSIVFCIWLVVNILLIMVIIWLLYGYYMVNDILISFSYCSSGRRVWRKDPLDNRWSWAKCLIWRSFGYDVNAPSDVGIAQNPVPLVNIITWWMFTDVKIPQFYPILTLYFCDSKCRSILNMNRSTLLSHVFFWGVIFQYTLW